MIICRFKVQCQPNKTAHVEDVFEQVIRPNRSVKGVISFDIGRDLVDPNSFIAVTCQICQVLHQ